MAFATQKDFFNIPFLTESYELGCKKACVKLKSYESTEDNRAWASDGTKQSKFLSDLVTCEYPIGEGEGDFSKTDRQVAVTGGVIQRTVDIGSRGSTNTSVTTGKHNPKQDSYEDSKNKGILASGMEIMTGGDSLLQCANVHLAEYQKLLKINTTLEEQLEVSNEHLQTVKLENTAILEILANKLDSNTTKDFYNKIQKFTTAGKFNKNEENEMLQIYQKMNNMNESYKLLQTENNYFKILIEKLTNRVKLESITVQPEQSQDIGYLQKEINSLRKECVFLRQIEEDFQKSKQLQSKTLPSLSEQDAENIKVIIKERNSLREKCKSLKALEKQLAQLSYESQEARKEASGLNSTLMKKTQHINTIEEEMQNMQKYYEKKKQDSCWREECLKTQLEDLKEEFVKAKCEAQKAHALDIEISCLRNELLKRDLAINDYDCQYMQLMVVVNELQSVKLQCLHDKQTQTCKEPIDELTFYTCATLEEILKELKRRGCLNNELLSAYNPEPAGAGIHIGKDENEVHCCAEIERLKQEIIEMQKRMREKANCEEICNDALERLKELETQNSQLLHNNQDLKGKLVEGEERLASMLKKLAKLDEDISKNGQEATVIARDLEENMALVRNISDVQLKNQQLVNAVTAVNSRDDEKIIDDLRRQLEEELAKLRKCQQDNAYLLEEVKQRETDLKEVNELNDKLMAENNKLKNIAFTPPSKDETKEEDKRDEITYKETPSAMDYSGKNIPTQKAADQEYFKNGIEKIKDRKPEDNGKKKQSSQMQQRRPSLQALNTSSSNKQRPIYVDEQKIADFTDSDGGFAARQKQKVTPQTAKYMNDFHASALKSKASGKQFGHEQRKDLALDEFVNKKSDSLRFNLQSGHCFEKEFRKILEEFIFECSNHFCQVFNAKSKLYIICHKLCHNGIDILNFQELAYIHKKIYNQADKLLPGCMLDMILTEHREQVESILTSVVMPRLIQGQKLSFKASDVNMDNDDQKCCCCKNELCCSNSEEMLKDKVSKLEKDIGIAREYLETLRNIPLEDNLSTDNENSTDTNNSTYRASSPVPIQQKLGFAKHVKKLKARSKKQTGT